MSTEAAVKKDTQKLQRAIVDGLEDVKAQDIQVFDTEHLSPLFERVIVASGTSNRQTKALAASVRDAVREAGFSKPRVEGEDNGEWIIVDCGAAVAHIMQPAIRQYYHLEEIWGDKPVRMRLGAAKPAAATRPVAEPEAPSKPPSLRRASAAKTAIRAAEQAARAERTGPTTKPAKSAARKVAAKTGAKTGPKTGSKTGSKTVAKTGSKTGSKTAAPVAAKTQPRATPRTLVVDPAPARKKPAAQSAPRKRATPRP